MSAWFVAPSSLFSSPSVLLSLLARLRNPFMCNSRVLLSLLLSTALLLLSACQMINTTAGGDVGIKRKQMMLLSSSQVESMSVAAYQKAVDDARQKGALNKNPEQLARLQRIATRLEAQVGVFRQDAVAWKWEVNIEQKDELNAYCSPGGKIMFFSGIIDKLKMSDDEIAAVMGHEIAHALREHGRERMSQAYAQQAVMLGIAMATNMDARKMQIMQTVGALAITLPNSREHESEADEMGIELAARAGYDPRGAVSLWQKMSASGGGSVPQFMSTHPSPAARIQDLQKRMPVVVPLYEQAKSAASTKY